MNKKELVAQIAETADITQTLASAALDGLTNAVSDALARQEAVAITGFGSFSVKARAARTGRNPKTGEPLEIKAANVPGFKPGKALKDAVNS